MGIPEEIAELEMIISNAKRIQDKASEAIKKLKRAESGVAVLQDSDTYPLEPVQRERDQSEAKDIIAEIKSTKIEAPPVADPVEPIEPDPIGVIGIEPTLEPMEP